MSLDRAKLCILQMVEFKETYDIMSAIGAPLTQTETFQLDELLLDTIIKISSHPQQDALNAYFDQTVRIYENQRDMKKSIYEGMMMGAPDKQAMTKSILESVEDPLRNCAG